MPLFLLRSETPKQNIRIEKNLKIVSKTLLVDLPDDQSFTVQEFVDMQRKHIVTRSRLLQVRALLQSGRRVTSVLECMPIQTPE